MTQDKDFKRLVRERMEKTGESYVTASSRLRAPPKHSTRANMQLFDGTLQVLATPLDDLVERANTEQARDPHWLPSWSDINRVSAYVGPTWAAARESVGNDYTLTFLVLAHLGTIATARAKITAYLKVACAPHDTPIGVACSQRNGDLADVANLTLPQSPVVCTWRVLAAHDRLAALELFEREPGRPWQMGRRNVLSLSADQEGVHVHVKVQQRHPQPFNPQRLYIANAEGWLLRDLRIGGKSMLAPHLDLPAFLFDSSVEGPHLLLHQSVDQDQWIEIEALRPRGDGARFHAALMGTTPNPETRS